MIEPASRCPLHWPAGQPRTSYRHAAKFEVDFGRSRDELLSALNLLGTRNVILSTNVALRQDGLPYANMPEPKDPGVAVYFDRNVKQMWKPYVIACDTYSKVRWNVRAIWATVEALRSIKRHGASSMLEQAFTGFAALPPKLEDEPWWMVLGLPESASLDDIQRRYRDMASANHPDRGGDPARMVAINKAYESARGEGR
ncbi:MAG TPA: J domain-containing protein [Kofleriaceae bacterium]|nr:J domain-containing protein [Kofleriaceae bacterium]